MSDELEDGRVRLAAPLAHGLEPVADLPPLHLQPALSYLGYTEGSLPETEKLARENFSVPLWAGIATEQQERVVEVVRAAVGAPVA